MPNQPSVSPPTKQVTAAYAAAEGFLLVQATRILRQSAFTLNGRLQALARLRALVTRVVTTLQGFDSVAAQAVQDAADDGDKTARRTLNTPARGELARTPGGGWPPALPPGLSVDNPDQPFNLSEGHGDRAYRAIRDDLISSLEDVRRRVTRLPDDIFKVVGPKGAMVQVLDNDLTPAQAQALAWRQFTRDGVTGFTDRSGRDWSLSAYVEMAVRTASARAFNDSHMQVMRAVGVHYFTVPPHGSPCPLCWPWQGLILTDGPTADPTVHTDGTIQDAIDAGLWHPNCKHVLAPYFPGITVLHQQEAWGPLQQAEYDASQRQRALERAIRQAKQDAQTALTPEDRIKAVADVRKAQARMREFIANTGRSRQSRREQVHLAMDHVKVPGVPSATQPRL